MLDSTVKALAESQTSTPNDAPHASDTETPADIGTDLTVANASATELDAGDAKPLNGGTIGSKTNGISNADVADDAANEIGESQWDVNDISASQEWVDVKIPRDPAETETGLEATPAKIGNTQSWADDQPDAPPEPTPAPTDPNDGFHQVQRNKGRNEREGGGGEWRGRGRGGYRGRGRGGHGNEGRGRGRGNHHSGMPPRPRRQEES